MVDSLSSSLDWTWSIIGTGWGWSSSQGHNFEAEMLTKAYYRIENEDRIYAIRNTRFADNKQDSMSVTSCQARFPINNNPVLRTEKQAVDYGLQYHHGTDNVQ